MYLTTTPDPHLQAVVKHQLHLADRGRYSTLQAANSILEGYQLGVKISEEGVKDSKGEGVSPKLLTRILKRAQFDTLTASLEAKTIHGVFYKQCQEEGWDTLGSHAWLLDGRVQAQTEGLIVAAQDGVIHTRAYQHRVQKKPISPTC